MHRGIAQSHRASKWNGWDMNAGNLIPESMCLTTMPYICHMFEYLHCLEVSSVINHVVLITFV